MVGSAPRDDRVRFGGGDTRARPGDVVEAFQAAAGRCGDLAGLKQLLEEATRDLGFSCFALLHHRALREPCPKYIRIDTYPQAWADELTADHLPANPDPVHQACARTITAFEWSDLPRLVPLTVAQRRLIERSRRHGLCSGMTVPVHVPGEPAGSCSFAWCPDAAPTRPARHAAELIAGRAFAAARRLQPGRAGPQLFPPRELQCVRLVARGKTDWEIGRILGISPQTARQYVRRARARCDVATRTQLAVLAARHGLLD